MGSPITRRLTGAVIVLVVLGAGLAGLARVLASPPARDLGPGIVVTQSPQAPSVAAPNGTGAPSSTPPADTASDSASTSPANSPAPSSSAPPPARPSSTTPARASTHPRAPVTPLPPSDPDDDDDDDDDDGPDSDED
ncbi:hypothetical protein [Arthrobacter sp. JSM 101049]|uniref:hypothetical protein n=1 Tax=Arthrobacter sp. JSM 101049 TaxID=929097 RepID=UPI003562D760